MKSFFKDRKLRIVPLLWLFGLLPVLVSAAITSESQRLDEFSFKKGLTTTGGLTFANTFYQGSDSLVVRDPYAFYLSGDLNLNLWGVSMPFSFSYSNTQKSYAQPFNKFKLNPSYKWARLLVGTNVLNLSPYTLSDHEFTGVGVELTPGNWVVSGMYGRLRKAVEYDPLIDNLSSVSYKRMGYAAKVGYSADFGEYNVTLFHGEDDKNSLEDAIPEECLVTPQKNTAVSAAVTQRFCKYFYVHGEYAVSLFNSNILTEDMEAASTDNFMDRLFGKRMSDRYVDALNAAAGYQGKVWGVALKYERVAPYYSSLGGYYFVNDVENYTVAPNLKLFDGKLSLSGNFGLQYNNLNNEAQNDTRRTIYSANAAFTSGKAWNASLSFSNFTTYTKVKPESYPFYTDALDSLNFYQVSRSVVGAGSYTFGTDLVSNVFSLSASYQESNFMQEDELSSFSEFYSGNLGFSRQVSPIALGWSLFMNANYCTATGMETLYCGPSAALSKGFLENALTSGLSCSYNFNKASGKDDGSLLNSRLALSYMLDGTKKKLGRHTFSLGSGYTRYFGGMANAKKDYEFLTTLTYGIGF